jgi:hypothetical protein
MSDRATDTDRPNRASNMEKAESDPVETAKETRTEQDRWTSDSDTVERQDHERLEPTPTSPDPAPDRNANLL